MTNIFADVEVISAYSRAQAIEDGELVDVTEAAREAGFTMPVAITRAAWDSYVKVPHGVLLQDERGRLHDLLTMLLHAISRRRSSGDQLLFKLHVRNDNYDRTPALCTLKAIRGRGDNADPVITVLLPDED